MNEKKILIIDDDPAVREMYAQKLISLGYRVMQADDGIPGLSSAITEKPDLILLDVKMTYMNGFEMSKKLREQGEWGKNVPVIFLTNISPDEEDQLKAVTSTSPAYYLIKSNTNPDDLVVKVKEVLAHS